MGFFDSISGFKFKKPKTSASNESMENLSSLVFCWGNNQEGQVGVGGVDEQVHSPCALSRFPPQGTHISDIACGYAHTLFLLNNGSVYSCGSNEEGELGQSVATTHPTLIELLSNYRIIQVAAGRAHSLALTDNGQVLSWGSEAFNAIGRDANLYEGGAAVENNSHYPKFIKLLLPYSVIQICTFNEHSLALTDQGEVYAWGRNDCSQTGIPDEAVVKEPRILKNLENVAIKTLSAGGKHCLAVSYAGNVYAWGDNSFGQLGLGDKFKEKSPVTYPVMLKTGFHISTVYCGEDFSIILSDDGKILSFGSNTYGQSGHKKSTVTSPHPTGILELMGSKITKVSVGRRHSLCLCVSDGCTQIYSFGLSKTGQCAIPNGENLNWNSPTRVDKLILGKSDPDSMVIDIFAGGNHSFALVSLIEQGKNHIKSDLILPKQMNILRVDKEFIEKATHIGSRSKKSDDDAYMVFCAVVERLFSSPQCLNASFFPENYSKDDGVCLLDPDKIREWMNKLLATKFSQLIRESIRTGVLPKLRTDYSLLESLKVMLILPLLLVPSGQVVDREFVKTYLIPLLKISTQMAKEPEAYVSQWMLSLKQEHFVFYVNLWTHSIQKYLDYPRAVFADLRNRPEMQHEMTFILSELVYLYIMKRNHDINSLPHTEFYLPKLHEVVDLVEEYRTWLAIQQNYPNKIPTTFSFCKYPFLFDPTAKTILLQTENKIHMVAAAQHAQREQLMSLLMHGGGMMSTETQYFHIIISRENIVQEALSQLVYSSHSQDPSLFRRPLRVKFQNEEAEDAGGVQKEFFLLLMKDLLDTKYGMFVSYPDTRTIWFNDRSFEEDTMFFLVGITCGLAIHNNVIINVQFPLPLYKKLLKQKTNYLDINYLDPTTYRSFESLLAYEEDDFEDVFALDFTISRERFGEVVVDELCPNGKNIFVTKNNRKEYVELYADYVLNKSVEKQFKAFNEGFYKVVTDGGIVKIFLPDELMAMVCGNESYDWNLLEKNTEYKNEYTRDHKVIKWFWEVFYDLDLELKKKFLLYLTGCDRVPITGMEEIHMVIQPVKGCEHHLPVAHTCFNLLDLPLYKSKKDLQEKIVYALEHATGFALV